MEAIYGFAIYFALTIVIGVVAGKKGRSAVFWTGATVFLGFASVILPGRMGMTYAEAASAPFVVAVALLVVVLMLRNEKEIAQQRGEFGDYRKCPVCAEPIRREAVKCRFCGSAVNP